MDYPNRRGHHHRRSDEDEYPPPGRPQPPPSYYDSDPPPPQTHVYHSSHTGPGNFAPPPPVNDYGYGGGPPPVNDYGYAPPPVNDYGYAPPPPSVGGYGYSPPPPPRPDVDSYTSVEHVSHHSSNFPAVVHHNSHQNSDISSRPPVRMFTKAEPNYSLTIRDGNVILAPFNPSDPFQQWVKDERYSTRVKDEEGFPSFALVNKATGQAMKHSIAATQPVQLTPYNPDFLDESVLWTESRDLGDTFRTIRMVSNIRLNVDAFNGDQNHGGVRDGTHIVLWEWKKGDNQRWKIVPY